MEGERVGVGAESGGGEEGQGDGGVNGCGTEGRGEGDCVVMVMGVDVGGGPVMSRGRGEEWLALGGR